MRGVCEELSARDDFLLRTACFATSTQFRYCNTKIVAAWYPKLSISFEREKLFWSNAGPEIILIQTAAKLHQIQISSKIFIFICKIIWIHEILTPFFRLFCKWYLFRWTLEITPTNYIFLKSWDRVLEDGVIFRDVAATKNVS